LHSIWSLVTSVPTLGLEFSDRLQAQLPDETKTAAIRAFNKLLWIQNDLISRHYTV